MADLMNDYLLIGDKKTVIEMISDQVPKLIEDKSDRPSNVHGKRNLSATYSRQFLFSITYHACIILKTEATDRNAHLQER